MTRSRRALLFLGSLALLLMLAGCGDDGSGGADWDLQSDTGDATDAGPISDGGADVAPPSDTDPGADTDSGADADSGTDTDASGCDEPDPSLDCRQNGCSGDQTCIVWEDACTPSSCSCEDGQWSCSRDCEPNSSVCVDDPEFCADENLPSKDCRDYGCDDGMSCELARDGCRAGSCFCDPVEQTIGCTDDCQELYECVKDDHGETCNGMPNPAGCYQDGCPDDQECVIEPNGCSPSACSCGASGWTCTSDCGGGGTCE